MPLPESGSGSRSVRYEVRQAKKKGEDAFATLDEYIGDELVHLVLVCDGHGGSVAAHECASHLLGDIVQEARDCSEAEMLAFGFTPAHNWPMHLTTSHRLEERGQRTAECHRVTAAEGKVARAMNPNTGAAGGPLRAWPGGLAMGRSLGDADCGAWLLAEPDIFSCVLPDDGCELLVASDGLWDAVSLPTVYSLVERFPPMERSVKDLLSTAVDAKGLHDDITLLLVRVVPAADEGRTGYWTAHEEAQRAKAKRSPLSRRLGARLSSGGSGKLARPPSWHPEYFEKEISVKGGMMFASLSLANHASPAHEQMLGSSPNDISAQLNHARASGGGRGHGPLQQGAEAAAAEEEEVERRQWAIPRGAQQQQQQTVAGGAASDVDSNDSGRTEVLPFDGA